MEDVRGNRAEKSRGTQHPTPATPKNEPSDAPKFPTTRTDSLENLHARFFFLAVREPSLLSAPNAPPSRRHFPADRGAFVLQRLGVVQFCSSFRHREGEKPSTDGDDRVGPRTSTRHSDRRGGASTRASGRACRSRAGIGRGRSRRSAIGVRDRGARRRRGSEKKAPGRTRGGLETRVVDRGEDERARPGRRRDHRPARDDARRLFRRARRIAHR
jgi:hypothetical protein